MQVVRVDESHINEVARLFDLYRQFYQCEPDYELALKFIADRVGNQESTIFVALSADGANGFVQLYPSFCSVQAIKIYILYDLYVDAHCRNRGVGAMLMNEAARYAKNMDANRLDLLTEFSNLAGQHLYEKLGYRKANEDHHAYSLQI